MNPIALEQITRLRKELHQYPELSGQEAATASRIVNFLEATQPTSIVGDIGGHGVVVVYDSGRPGPSIGFRCELDALPIEETNVFPHASHTPGVSHKCGHDGHMAIVAGIGLHCKEHPVRQGKLTLIFQPAEETGYGAQSMLDDAKMKGLLPANLFALHNIPGVEKGLITAKKGIVCPASEGLIMTLKGKTSHAGQPEKGNNPAPVISAIQMQAQHLHDSRWKTAQRTKITTVMINLGSKAFGVNPGDGCIAFTLRSDSNKELAIVKSELIDFAKNQCDSVGLSLSLESTDPFKAVVNDTAAFKKIETAVNAAGQPYEVSLSPFPWSEDFGRFSEVTSTGFFGLGAGKGHPELHHDTYDFPDELIPIGTRLFLELGKELWETQCN